MNKISYLSLLILCFGLVTTINAQDLLTHDFNDRTLGPYESGNLNRMTFKDGALECTWTPSDYTGSGTNSKKTEFRAKDNAYQFRQEFWTGFKLKIHDDYMATNTNTDAGLMQIWGFDEAAGNANHYAMLKFDGRDGGSLVWYHRYGGGSYAKKTVRVRSNFPRNRFVRVVIHVNLSSNGSTVRIWLDDVLELELLGQTMGWGDMDANGQTNQSYSTPGSWGMYNYRNEGGYDQAYDSPSHYYNGYQNGETRTVTYDDLTLWNGPNGYDIVSPPGSTNPPSSDNLALTGAATQSSTNQAHGGAATRAIDNNTNGSWPEGSVTHTETETNPWWQVDLESSYSIDEIVVFNRTDCCTNRLSNYTVSVINSDGNTTFSKSFTSAPNPSIIIDAGGAIGQIIKVQINGNGTLSLAEVQVYGEAATTTDNFQLVKRNATGFAIDGGSGAVVGRSVELYTNVQHNNLTWTEINRGGGYYSYQKYNTNVCLDGGSGGVNGQNVTLQPCNASDYGQQWQKIDAGSGHYRLQKRGTNYSLDGDNGGAIDQNVYLWTSSSTNQNQQWRFDKAVSTRSGNSDTKNTDLNLYPIPLSNVLNISMNSSKTARLDIFNSTGQSVHKEQLKNGIGSISLEHLPIGLYIVKITIGKEIISRKVLIEK